MKDFYREASKPYLFSVLLLQLIMPVVTSVASVFYLQNAAWWSQFEKWFVFYGVGARLFIAGVNQVLRPQFTAREIFQIDDTKSFVLVQELGFANICIGMLGLVSLWIPGWRNAGVIIGGLFYAMAAVRHILHRPASANEWIALVSDWFIVIVILSLLLQRFLSPPHFY